MMDMISLSHGVRFFYDIVLVVGIRTEQKARLGTWGSMLEEKGLWINIIKKEYLWCNSNRVRNDGVKVHIFEKVLYLK